MEDKWTRILRAMLKDYRKQNPHDKRGDRELLTSLMDHFVETGVVKKSADGKYILPDTNADELIAMIEKRV